MKTYYIQETKTETITTQYAIQAESEKEALENFRHRGQYQGDWVDGGKDRVKVVKVEEE